MKFEKLGFEAKMADFKEKLMEIIVGVEMQFKRSLIMLLIFPLMLLGMLGGCSNAQANIDPKLEAQVLDIIRKNPQAILESVQNYQKAEKDKQSQGQNQALKQIQAKPQSFIQGSPTKGATAQKLILIEFSDFQCPYCAKAHDVVQKFMATRQDRVTLVYKHFPLTNIHPQAEPAALASYAADRQNQFWEFHDRLFKDQTQLGDPLYTAIATELKLDLNKFNSDRASESAQKAINKDVELGRAIGVPGTPFFLLNGVPIPASENLLADLESAVK